MTQRIQHVYFFGDGVHHDLSNPNDVLGCKGANLAEMTRLGLPVPPGFTVSTVACRNYYEGDETLSPELVEEATRCLERLERITDRALGDPERPLLVSVRSGASVSMPGMMDTILNLGLNDDVVAGIAARPGMARFAYDAYRRFLEMYSEVVLGMKAGKLAQLFERVKIRAGAEWDHEVDVESLKHLVDLYKQTIWTKTGTAFPMDPMEQLWGALAGVFKSWNNRRAVEYRQLYSIPQHLGTAVTIQRMVFGNLDDSSATGVALTRDPSSGEKVFYGEYLPNAQGEDVVAGLHTPRPIKSDPTDQWSGPSLEQSMPEVYQQLEDVVNRLEQHFGDLQDIEFTVEQGKLWMLQTRSGKRSAKAAIRIAVEMVEEGLISPQKGLLQIQPQHVAHLVHPTFSPDSKQEARAEGRALARGLPASPGAESGPIVFTPARAVEMAGKGKRPILVRTETIPDDIHGVSRSCGILTTRGGMTSHAAVVARGMGKCCIVGCRDAEILKGKETILRVGGRVFREGDELSLDGGTGEVFSGSIEKISPELGREYETLLRWIDRFSPIHVLANAHTPHEIRTALAFGAGGVGLCRTEHLFTSPERMRAVQEMILAPNEDARRAVIQRLLPLQIEDYKDIFKAVGSYPITMRLLDPPLNEFLPGEEESLADLAEALGESLSELHARIRRLRETNPLFGHRGCRIGVTFPEMYEMQVEAILRAAKQVETEDGIAATPSIMVPFISTPRELEFVRVSCTTHLERVAREIDFHRYLPFGTMIELPNAIIQAEELAREVDFFNFGTNDLTQAVLGISREDSRQFMPLYIDIGLLPDDPFGHLHPSIRTLITEAVRKGRKGNPDLRIGLCGDHANEPENAEFLVEKAIDYLSCSPYRVPVVRLATARAALEGMKG